jgi:hypothetical protein
VKGRRILLRVLYWLAVLVVSLAILVGLILLLESRDESSVGHRDAGPVAVVSSPSRT